MTYQQIWDLMGTKEKLANRIMCLCKIGDDGRFVKNSIRNKILYQVVKRVLRIDPLDRNRFYASLLDETLRDETEEELNLEVCELKAAWN